MSVSEAVDIDTGYPIEGRRMPILILGLAVFFLVWYVVVQLLALNGFVEILIKFRGKKKRQANTSIEEEILEGVTILRPLKGVDPELDICLSSAFEQDYPAGKFEIIFCVESPRDPAIPVAQSLLEKYPNIPARILVGSETSPDHYGPNPKVNNLAKGYFAAEHDIIWVWDSNVWVAPGALRRSVLSLQNSTDNGRCTINPLSKRGRRVVLVHHLPLAIAVNPLLGACCDEMFLLTAHSKFYCSLNNVAVAPCVNGKSNLYRRSDLDHAVYKMGKGYAPSTDGQSGDAIRDAAFYSQQEGHGIRFFARYIGEDNMIATALWNSLNGRTGMTGDCAIQPLGGINSTTLKDYIKRRVRWLRARKYMVLAATLLEPSTECFVSGIFGTFAISVLWNSTFFLWKVFITHVISWVVIDYVQFHTLILFAADDEALAMTKSGTPYFVKASFDAVNPSSKSKDVSVCRTLKSWLPLWMLRESLALPIWIIAMAGHEIIWRNKPFRIKADLSAEEL